MSPSILSKRRGISAALVAPHGRGAELSCARWDGKPEDYHLRRCTGGYGEPGTRPVISADKAAAHNAAPPTKIKSQSKMLMVTLSVLSSERCCRAAPAQSVFHFLDLTRLLSCGNRAAHRAAVQHQLVAAHVDNDLS